MRSRVNITLIIAILMIAIAGIGFFSAFKKVKDEVNVMVAKEQLAPFIAAPKGSVVPLGVPRASVRDTDLTEAEYKEIYAAYIKNPDDPTARLLIPTMVILQGQRIDERALASEAVRSFTPVLADERVIAVTATASGAVFGLSDPGSLVDITLQTGVGSTQSSAPVSTFAKVICVSSKVSDCQGVIPVEVPVGESKERSREADVKLLLAVAEEDALIFSGKKVDMSLNTLCRFDEYGYFRSRRQDLKCAVPADRDASKPPARLPSSQAPATNPANSESDSES
jgi:hypothetical protein